MDIRIVETLASSGVLKDPGLRLDGDRESVSLDWSYRNSTFSVIDRNLNYSLLPFTMGSGLVKKVFLTYNSISYQTKEILETVVMESANGADPDAYPGYNNSDEWIYSPANFRIGVDPSSLASNDLLTWEYPYSEGVTLIKQFLNSESNTDEVLYTSYYRRPTMTSFEMANVEGSKVFTDGWYTSYVIAVKEYDTLAPTTAILAQAPEGVIVYYPEDGLFYVNITGTCLDPAGGGSEVHLPPNDTVNWRANPTFAEWQTLMRNVLQEITPSMDIEEPEIEQEISPLHPIYFIESNHLATPDLNRAILTLLQKTCARCHEDKFNMTHIEDWCRLTQKRLGSFIFFSEERFKESQRIILSSRAHCEAILYGKNCNFNRGGCNDRC
jgi:hypothetical protein